MNKEQLVEAIAKRAKLTKKGVSAYLDSFVATVTDALAKGGKLTLVGFGTFQVRHRKARTGRNPRTGAKLNIAARKSPVFTAGKGLKEAVGGHKGHKPAAKKAPAKKK